MTRTPSIPPSPAAALPARRAPAFTLIEVLIAVLILSLGLLGIGALFPVVIRQQRLSIDSTFGLVAGQSAKGQLQGVVAALPRVTSLPPNPVNRSFLGNWRDASPDYARPERGGIWPASANPAFPRGGWFIPLINPTSGELQFGIDDGTATPPANPPGLHRIPVAERLWPRDAGPGVDPQFVWDVAVQRVPDANGAPEDDAIRFAIFVRRIDPRIRLPQANMPGTGGREVSLWDILTNRTIQPVWRRVPVAASPSNATPDSPTYDGLGNGSAMNYSPPITCPVQFRYDPASADPALQARDRLSLASSPTSTDRAHWDLLAQVNQRCLDNLGNQYTVVEVGADYIRVSPPIPDYITREMSAPVRIPTQQQIRQVVFTPQIPAAVVTWTVNP